jgi:hypothetical protein
MGQATRVAEDILANPITTAEAASRREATRKLSSPEATPGGEIVERPRPEAAPRPVFTAEPATWD